MKFRSSLTAILVTSQIVGSAFAATSTFTWDAISNTGGTPTNSFWNNAQNWVSDIAPTYGNETDLIFTGTRGTVTNVTSNKTVRSVTFDAQTTNGFQVKTRGTSGATTAGPATLTFSALSGNASVTVEAGAGTIFMGAGPVTGTGAGGNIILTSSLEVIHNGGNLLTIGDANSLLTGGGSVTKSGSGTLVLGGANTYAGDTTISGGTLKLTGGGAVGNSPNILVGANTTFDVTGVTGTYTLGATQTLSGTGIVLGAATIAGTLSPGNSPGTLATGSQTWTVGADYNFQIMNATGTAGTGYDTITATGVLDLSSLTAAGFSVNLWSLSSTGPDVSGNASNFDNSVNQSWTLLTTTGGITGFDPANFVINTAPNNGTDGFSNSLGSGSFSLSQIGNNLQLNFTAVPESSALAFGLLGTAVLLRRRSR